LPAPSIFITRFSPFTVSPLRGLEQMHKLPLIKRLCFM